MKLTVNQATNYDKKKDGGLITDNRGKQKWRTVIKTNEYGDEFLSGFVYRPIQVGDVIEAEIKTETYNGAEKKVFSIVTPTAQKAEATQSSSDILSEMKTHTVLLKEILNKAEGIYMSISTYQTIESIKKPASSVVPEVADLPLMTYPEAQEVSGENDFGNMWQEQA